MKRLRVIYNVTARLVLRQMAPSAKSIVKKLIEDLADNTSQGKALQDDFLGYYSARYNKWRIIYTVDEQHQRLMIHLIEKRATVYETLKMFPSLQLHERRAPYGLPRASVTKP